VHNDLLKVENETRLARDPVSRAIINTDNDGYKTYIQNRDRKQAMENAVKQNSEDIQSIKEELGDIKNMLSVLVANIQNREK
jgi:gamma-glutamylcysteine synthetase